LAVRGAADPSGRPVDDTDVEKILNSVVDSGSTFVDHGRSYECMGRFLSHGR
jgi:hypothetical protein